MYVHIYFCILSLPLKACPCHSWPPPQEKRCPKVFFFFWDVLSVRALQKEEILCLFIFFRFQAGPFLGHQGEVKLPWTKCLPSCGHLHKRYTTSQSRRRGSGWRIPKNLFQIVKGTNKLTNQHVIWNKWYYSTYNSTHIDSWFLTSSWSKIQFLSFCNCDFVSSWSKNGVRFAQSHSTESDVESEEFCFEARRLGL